MSRLFDSLSREARNAPESGIVEVFNAGWGRDDLIPLWAGEGDLPTPDFICEAAKQSLDRGETFYTYQRGIPQLREALASYHQDLYQKPFSSDRFFVTGSGMQSIQLAVQAVAGSGSEVIVPTPAWPNITAAVNINGAHAVCVPMPASDQGWDLDLAAIEGAITPSTTALFLNSPCNPTGWTATRDQLAAVLDLTRKHGLWIIADEIYALFYYGDGARAPSFYDVADDDDRIIYVNSMSKNWAMTGWRLGWISAPPVLGQVIESLIQYSTSGVPSFSQWGAIAALKDGSEFLASQMERARTGRETVVRGLQELNRVRLVPPEGAFYLFFEIDGVTDTRQFALDLVRQTGVGLAPGTAFGAGGEPYLRLCYARRKDHLEEAVHRISGWLPEI
ncbi:pyridoxal phosphate-dependent aminotransferase [Roseibium denhamense]|uniref:Aminotransferase n=1 Tax=Roseibium denhamense TaxID=76305 RepID=A0ABY1P6Z4_9HYPH|nr:pyridoxal phosphate-dependent aminotransferase [Roseibium denhamense]MTI07223.1 pyridoxal phosphate-dependent aminotransferase [Roseibium denhamense]SMP26470.1 Aspartate/methionine/tyrosine aminotransferase [Roseibium denhamense]